MKMIFRMIIGLLLTLALLFSISGTASASPGVNKVRVLIGFNRPASSTDEVMVRNFGGKVQHRFHLVSAISAEIPESMINRIKSLRGISYVELDGEVQAMEQIVPWGIPAINADDTQSYNQGNGIKVAVIDTGIDLTHPDLQVAGNVSFVSGTSSGNDDNGHGTHVAGTIAALNNSIGVIGVAPQVQLYAVKVLSRSGSGSWSSVVDGIEWAVDHKMNIINMSLGSSASPPTTPTYAEPITMKMACDNAYNAGVLIVAAAGNNGTSYSNADNVIYPAKYDSVIAVGAVDSGLKRASFSSTGPAVELAAPGVSIYSTLPDHANYLNTTYGDPLNYGLLDGTSMATPHVTGVAALVFASGITDTNGNGRINDEVRTRLQNTAYDLGTYGRDREYGYGLVDAATAIPGPSNHTPVANAGADQTVVINNLVTLDGSGSSDQDGDALTFSWLQTGGTQVVLSDITIPNPSFTPVTAGIYSFQLTVSDSELSSSDDVTVSVRNENSPPSDPLVSIFPTEPKTTDNLVCNIVNPSTDVDEDSINYSYSWFKDGEQTGQTTNTVAASNTAKGQVWKCEVTPNDGFTNGTAGIAQVTILNTAPAANAGPDQTVGVNSLVTLNGNASSDIDGDTLTYQWSQTGGPATITLYNDTSVSATFTPTTGGSYSFLLTVGDDTNTNTDEVTVNVSPEMHVESIVMKLGSAYYSTGLQTYATALVTVYDSNGVPVNGVKVTGYWSIKTSSYSLPTNYSPTNLYTDTQGRVTFKSISKTPTRGTTFTFNVNNLYKSGYTYNAAFNKATKGSVTIP